MENRQGQDSTKFKPDFSGYKENFKNLFIDMRCLYHAGETLLDYPQYQELSEEEKHYTSILYARCVRFFEYLKLNAIDVEDGKNVGFVLDEGNESVFSTGIRATSDSVMIDDIDLLTELPEADITDDSFKLVSADVVIGINRLIEAARSVTTNFPFLSNGLLTEDAIRRYVTSIIQKRAVYLDMLGIEAEAGILLQFAQCYRIVDQLKTYKGRLRFFRDIKNYDILKEIDHYISSSNIDAIEIVHCLLHPSIRRSFKSQVRFLREVYPDIEYARERMKLLEAVKKLGKDKVKAIKSLNLDIPESLLLSIIK